MPTESLRCTEELTAFFNELPMPKGLNGNEDRLSNYEDLLSPKVCLAKEVFRRMQDLYDAITSGRFFLCISQKCSFPEYYKEPTPRWADNWIRTQFLTSSIQWYNSAFDLYLQVNWLYFELFRLDDKSPNELTTETLDKILRNCTPGNIEKYSCEIRTEIYLEIQSFKQSECYLKIHKLCNCLKHKRRIEFEELSKGKHQFWINIENYDSYETLEIETIPGIIQCLNDYHSKISALCNYSIPYWSFNSVD